jgi:NAD(P)-dependent dehydrogenase (short-subunit alcohol dehydrogenase family)
MIAANVLSEMENSAMEPTAGRLVWITGASSGLGRALALNLARKGDRVIASARGVDALRRLAEESQGRVTPAPLDVTDAAACRDVIAGIETRHGPIDIAALNAGTHIPLSAHDYSASVVQQLLTINVMGAANCLEPLLATMRARRRGRIAVVASVAGYGGLPTASAYGASKAALINMCEALKPDCDQLGITLQLVNPGFVDTPLTAKNQFKMPFLMNVDRAAERFARGLDSTRFEITFPRRFAILLKLLNKLPYRAYFALVGRTTRT